MSAKHIVLQNELKSNQQLFLKTHFNTIYEKLWRIFPARKHCRISEHPLYYAASVCWRLAGFDNNRLNAGPISQQWRVGKLSSKKARSCLEPMGFIECKFFGPSVECRRRLENKKPIQSSLSSNSNSRTSMPLTAVWQAKSSSGFARVF